MDEEIGEPPAGAARTGLNWTELNWTGLNVRPGKSCMSSGRPIRVGSAPAAVSSVRPASGRPGPCRAALLWLICRAHRQPVAVLVVVLVAVAVAAREPKIRLNQFSLANFWLGLAWLGMAGD